TEVQELPEVDPSGRDDALSFFFSSRRRHTISYGDWSSDVCSSDLRIVEFCILAVWGVSRLAATEVPGGNSLAIAFLRQQFNEPRSEERRVGKECRSRWVGER